MTLTGLFALLASPTSWSSHWVWVVPALLILIGSAVRDRSPGRFALAGLVVLAAVTAPYGYLAAESGSAVGFVLHQIVGNSYVVLAAVSLLVAGWRATGAEGGITEGWITEGWITEGGITEGGATEGGATEGGATGTARSGEPEFASAAAGPNGDGGR